MNMTLSLRNLVLLFLVFGVSADGMAQHIYGLKQAKAFGSARQGPYYVHVGSYRSYPNATALKQRLSVQLSYPIYIQSSGSMHSVVIGPLLSAKAVRAVGHASVSEPRSNVVNHLNKSKQQVRHNNLTLKRLVSTIPPVWSGQSLAVELKAAENTAKNPEEVNEILDNAKKQGAVVVEMDGVIHIL